MKLRRPGSVIDWFLPSERGLPVSERTVFLIKVLTYDEWKDFLRKAVGVTQFSSAEEDLEASRRALGVGLVGVKNLWIVEDDGKETEFVLERSGTEISPASMAVLMPYAKVLPQAIQEASSFGVRDRKNSP
jgi:hypothetical protein